MVNNLYKIAILAIAVSTLSGCATIFHTVKGKFHTPDKNVTLVLSDNGGSVGSGTSVVVDPDSANKDVPTAKGGMAVFKLNNNTDVYVVTATKNKCFSSSIVLGRDVFNPMKLIDMGLPLVFGVIVFTSPNAKVDNPPVPFTIMFIESVAGWVPVGYGPWWTFHKDYNIPALQAIPYKQSKQNDLYVKSVDMKAGKDSIKETLYEHFRDYKHGDLLNVENGTDNYKDADYNIKVSLNNTLQSWNYIDSGKFALANLAHRSVYITCSVQSIKGTSINTFSAFNVISGWQLHSPDGSVITQATYQTSTSWGDYGISDQGVTDIAGDALSRAMALFIQTDKVQQALGDTVYSAKRKMNDTIIITASDSGGVKNLEQAAKAVVTIAGQEHPASGCIISPDGYVVTDSYALSDTSNDITVVLSDGSKVTAERLRSNDSDNVALLKIQKKGVYPYLVPMPESGVQVGSDAYSIGTPVAQELVQSISKGIISGQRKIRQHRFIQTDVAINPGVNGGALVTDKGVLLGMIVGKISGNSIQGLGFVLPGYYFERVLPMKFAK